MDFFGFEDKHLNMWEERLDGRENNIVEGERNLVFEWDQETVLGFLTTTEKTFRILNQERKEKLFDSRGLKLIEVTGRGKKAVYKVQPTIEFYYYVMMRRYESTRVRKMPAHAVDYMNHLITGNGLLIHEDGAVTVPVVMDMAEELAERHGVNADAVGQSLKMLRKTMNKYGYLVSGKDAIEKHAHTLAEYNAHLNGVIKMHRAYRKVGDKLVRISGSRAVQVDQSIRNEYKKKYEELEIDEDYMLDGLEGEERKEVLVKRRARISKFREEIASDNRFSSINVVYRSTASLKAHVDQRAIHLLMMAGITFPELVEFMKERIEFWNAYDLMTEARDEAEKQNPELKEIRQWGQASREMTVQEAAEETMAHLVNAVDDENEEEE
ncbi:hypothetical protein LG305_15675 (plasmid) [Exiguobacterium aurantiacum]